MSHFDERSGVVYCSTEWGQWAQTIEEVFIEVDVPDGTKSQNIRCDMTPTSISVTVNHQQIFKGKLSGKVITDDSIWTLEDKKLLRIVLSKSNRDAANCWRSLLEGQYAADAHVFDQMERKLTLERFQNE
ncbi:NudC domain-containing protein 2, partial [Geodia barretti]